MRIDRSKLERLSVLYEDDFLIAIGKPTGIAVHGGAGETGRATVIDILHAAAPAEIEIFPVHRLDRATSGVLLLAKSRDAARRLGACWPATRKVYAGLTFGAWSPPESISTALDSEERGALPAVTHFHPLAVLERFELPTTLLAISLGTGRMHQVRRHLASVGHPIVLDDKHGHFASNRAFARVVREAGGRLLPGKGLLLHAAWLEVPHPKGQRPVVIEARLPEPWSGMLAAAGGQTAPRIEDVALEIRKLASTGWARAGNRSCP